MRTKCTCPSWLVRIELMERLQAAEMSKEGIVIEAGLTRGKLFRRRDVVAYNEYEANRSLGQWEPGMLRLASFGFYG